MKCSVTFLMLQYEDAIGDEGDVEESQANPESAADNSDVAVSSLPHSGGPMSHNMAGNIGPYQQIGINVFNMHTSADEPQSGTATDDRSANEAIASEHQVDGVDEPPLKRQKMAKPQKKKTSITAEDYLNMTALLARILKNEVRH